MRVVVQHYWQSARLCHGTEVMLQLSGRGHIHHGGQDHEAVQPDVLGIAITYQGRLHRLRCRQVDIQRRVELRRGGREYFSQPPVARELRAVFLALRGLFATRCAGRC